MSEPPAKLIREFIDLDYEGRMAFAALVGEGASSQFIGVARYALDGEAQCEYAVAVLDEWQSRGVGSTLTTLLLEYARSQGIKKLHCEILATNRRMINLAIRMGMSLRAQDRDLCIVEGFRTL